MTERLAFVFRAMSHACAVGIVALLFTAHAYAAPSGMDYCSAENDTCATDVVDAWVVFGAGPGECDLTTGVCTGNYTPALRTYGEPFSVLCQFESFAGADPAPGQPKDCYYAAVATSPEPTPEFDPTSVPHLLQAVLAMGHVFMLWMGFRAGDKL